MKDFTNWQKFQIVLIQDLKVQLNFQIKKEIIMLKDH
jgi:hypothetical protein